MHHSAHPSSAAPGPAGNPARGRSARWWIGLGCVGMVLVLMALAVTGGVALLVVRSVGPGSTGAERTAPALTTFVDPAFSLAHPASWEQIEPGPEHVGAGTVVILREVGADEEVPRDEVIVHRFRSDVHALVECTRQAHWIGLTWDRAEEPEDVGPSVLGGRELAHHRATGEHLGVAALGEMWCADVGDEILQITADSFAGAGRSADVELILSSWTWQAG